jgi:hypothetical protein
VNGLAGTGTRHEQQWDCRKVRARRKLATDATQAAGGDKTVLKLRRVTERKQSKMGGDDEADV